MSSRLKWFWKPVCWTYWMSYWSSCLMRAPIICLQCLPHRGNIVHNLTGHFCHLKSHAVILLPITITCYFLSFPSIYLCLLFISWPVACLSPVDCIPFSYLILPSWSWNYLFDSRIIFPEYSIILLIIVLSSSTFFCLVILLMIGVYKLYSSPLLFPMLVCFVLLAPIHLPLAPLDLFKSSSYFWVDAFLFEPLNPWKQLHPSCYVETPRHPPVSLHRKNLWPYKVYAHPYLG